MSKESPTLLPAKIDNITVISNQIQDIKAKIDKIAEITDLIIELAPAIDWITSQLKHNDYLSRRNEELEFQENSYSLDGDANCNS